MSSYLVDTPLAEESLGDSHTDTAIALNNIAAIETSSGRCAERDLRRALSASQLQPADSGSIETNLSNLLRLDGRLAEANSHLQAAKQFSE